MSWSSYSYTSATGKRPAFDEHCRHYTWFTPFADEYPENLPPEVYDRLRDGGKGEGNGARWADYPTYFDAIAAANDAARRAIREGAFDVGSLDSPLPSGVDAGPAGGVDGPGDDGAGGAGAAGVGGSGDSEGGRPRATRKALPKWLDCGAATGLIGLFFLPFFIDGYYQGYASGKLLLGFAAFCGAWFLKFWFEPS